MSRIDQSIQERIAHEFDDLLALYKHIHANPELPLCEEKTSARVAEEFRAAGLETTHGVGGYGVVGMLRNGEGPTVLIRADMDALPLEEKTGLPWASKVVMKDKDGNDSPVMHACGHDMHTTCLVGTARVLSTLHDQWSGTAMFVGQPAEEEMAGARAMIEDGLYERFGRPDFCISQHVRSSIAAGKIGLQKGPTDAACTGIRMRIFGKGGHGSEPHVAVNPIQIAARILIEITQIIAHQVPARESLVITPGVIQSGHASNIIPDEALIRFTMRAYNMELRDKICESVRRAAESLARAAGMPDDKLPEVDIHHYGPSVISDPDLVDRFAGPIAEAFGEENIEWHEGGMGSEDFGFFGAVDPPVPSTMLLLGCGNPGELAEKGRQNIPGGHSPHFAPDAEPTIRTGIRLLSYAAAKLMGNR